MIRLTRTELMQAFRLALAAWVAFTIAALLGSEHAFWASMPVWVVAQPWRGVVFERALWRLVGTAVGGAVGLLLLMVSPSPWATAIAMALLLAAGGAISHLWQGVRSYIPLMSAITIAVVVIPAILAPHGGMALAMDRLICTFIGGVSVAVIVGLFTPRAKRKDFRAEVLRFTRSSREIALTTLTGNNADIPTLMRQAASIEGRARIVTAGSLHGPQRLFAIDAALAAALSLVEAAGTIAKSGDAALCQQALDVLTQQSSVPDLSSRAMVRLAQSHAALLVAESSLDTETDIPENVPTLRLAPPRDTQRAKSVALLAFVASLTGSAAIILTDNNFSAELTAFSMAIFVLVLGSTPFPQAFAPKVVVGVLFGVAAGALYRLGVQPYADGFFMLVLTIIPFMLLGSLARTYPKTAIFALDANMCFMLASQAGVVGAVPAADAVLVNSFFMALGTIIIVLCYMALPRPGQALIDNTANRLRRDLVILAERAPISGQRWAAIAGRRVMTLAIELDKVNRAIPPTIVALSDAGQSLNDLREAARDHGAAKECDAWVIDTLRNKQPPVPTALLIAELQPALTAFRTNMAAM